MACLWMPPWQMVVICVHYYLLGVPNWITYPGEV